MKLFEELRQRIKEKRNERIIERSRTLYQIAEVDNQLWITFSNAPILPCAMLKDAPLDALAQLRKLYVDNLTNRIV